RCAVDVLGTRAPCDSARVEGLDLMPRGDGRSDVVGLVRGLHGTVTMHEDLRIRFSYASTVPWVRRWDEAGTLVAIGGPDALVRRGPSMQAGERFHTSRFSVSEGPEVDIHLTWYPSHGAVPLRNDVHEAIRL